MRAATEIEAGRLAGASPDITQPTAKGKDGKGAAILFADVSKSMLMHERLGDRAALALVDKLLALAAKAVAAHHGRVVKTIGDEILAVLPTADCAARAARDLMVDVEGCDTHAGIKPGMHIGFHAGAFIERDNDVFGDAVNVASRLSDYAQCGQILTTGASAGGISPLVRRAMRNLGPLEIRGRREQIQVEEIAWREDEDGDTTVTEAVLETPDLGTRLEVIFAGRQWTVGPQARCVSIGRDAGADISVATAESSRNHGLIEYRNGGFFYTDMSLNGSYVSFGDTGETVVRRTEVVLSGRGVICLGHSADEPGERLAFHVRKIEH